MRSRDFVYWLQGFFEVSSQTSVSEPQTETIKRHLALVFKHEIDPSIGGDAEELQGIHDGKPFKDKLEPPSDHHRETLIRC